MDQLVARLEHDDEPERRFTVLQMQLLDCSTARLAGPKMGKRGAGVQETTG
jgi:hypothetical protein